MPLTELELHAVVYMFVWGPDGPGQVSLYLPIDRLISSGSPWTYASDLTGVDTRKFREHVRLVKERSDFSVCCCCQDPPSPALELPLIFCKAVPNCHGCHLPWHQWGIWGF